MVSGSFAPSDYLRGPAVQHMTMLQSAVERLGVLHADSVRATHAMSSNAAGAFGDT